ncbi:MAG: hypothetical protein FWE06_01025 [Oscillospiraceae bacterium]|nr:hypothetical protein [Oscillospiraceae bacterium]
MNLIAKLRAGKRGRTALMIVGMVLLLAVVNLLSRDNSRNSPNDTAEPSPYYAEPTSAQTESPAAVPTVPPTLMPTTDPWPDDFEDPHYEYPDNRAVADAQAYNPNIVGRVIGTGLDAHFIQGGNNTHPNDAIFLDWRSPSDFSAFNTLIFGNRHQSFDPIGQLLNRSFFDANEYLTIILPEQTINLRVMAVVILNGDELSLIDPALFAGDAQFGHLLGRYGFNHDAYHAQKARRQEFLRFIEQHAIHFRPSYATTGSRLVTFLPTDTTVHDSQLLIITINDGGRAVS